MIIPCIDLMDGKVVQLVQGREKALEGDAPRRDAARSSPRFPEIQVIDLDAAMGRGSNDDLVELLASNARDARRRRRAHRRARPRAGRTGRAQGDRRHGGLHQGRHQRRLPDGTRDAIGRERLIIALDSKGGRIVVKGWQEATDFTAEEVIAIARALLLAASSAPMSTRKA